MIADEIPQHEDDDIDCMCKYLKLICVLYFFNIIGLFIILMHFHAAIGSEVYSEDNEYEANIP